MIRLVWILLCFGLFGACSSDKRSPTADEINAFILQKQMFNLHIHKLLVNLQAESSRVDGGIPQGELYSLVGCKALVAESAFMFQSVVLNVFKTTLDNMYVELVSAYKSGRVTSNCKDSIDGALQIQSELVSEVDALMHGGVQFGKYVVAVESGWSNISQLSSSLPVGLIKTIGNNETCNSNSARMKRYEDFVSNTRKMYGLADTLNKQFRPLVLRDLQGGGVCYDSVLMGMLFRSISVLVVVEYHRVSNVVFAVNNKDLVGIEDLKKETVDDIVESLQSFELMDAYLRTLWDRENYPGFLDAGRNMLECYAAWKKSMLALLEGEGVSLPAPVK